MKNESSLRLPGRRLTRQRRLIFHILRSRRDHPTATEIHREAQEFLPSISLGTVYRNLRLLAEQGLIREITYLGEGSRFDAQTVQHSHLVCRRCGEVEDVPFDLPESWFERLTHKTGFKDISHALTFYGVCKNCSTEQEAHARPDDSASSRLEEDT